MRGAQVGSQQNDQDQVCPCASLKSFGAEGNAKTLGHQGFPVARQVRM